MNGIEYLENILPEFGDNPEMLGMEEVDGIYKLGGKHNPGPKPQKGIVDVIYTVRILPGSEPVDCTLTRNAPLTFELNSGQVLEGFNRAVKNLGIGDKALFVVPPSLAYGKKGKFGIVPPNAWLMYDIELLGVYESTNTPKRFLSDAKKAKEEGNKLLKANDIDNAIFAYQIGIDKTENLETESQEEKDEAKAILTACHANLSVVYLKLKEWDDAIKSCNKVFELEPYHIKSSFRIGQAYLAKGEYEKGIEMVQKALEKHPDEPNLKQIMSTLKEKLSSEKARQKKAYARMFNN